MGRSNQSFLKRQKEQKRKEKAEEKRAVRQARRQNPEPQRRWDDFESPAPEAPAPEPPEPEPGGDTDTP